MSQKSDSTLGVSAMQRHQEYYFRDGNICFVVENIVFRLHRHFIERESEYFRRRLAPPGDGEDGSPDSPYMLHDVKSEEFAQLIWVWYNPRYSYSKQDKSHWLTILRLATMWEFNEIRNLAIRHLEEIKLDPIEKIMTYTEYAVDAHLLLPSYIFLSTTEATPSLEEAKILGLDLVLKLTSARELLLLRASGLGCKVRLLAEDVVRAIVAESFGLTLPSTPRMEGQANGNVASGDSQTGTQVATPKQDKKGSKLNGSAELQQPSPVSQGDPRAPGGSGGNKGKK